MYGAASLFSVQFSMNHARSSEMDPGKDVSRRLACSLDQDLQSSKSHPISGPDYALIEPDQGDSATVKHGKYIHVHHKTTKSSG